MVQTEFFPVNCPLSTHHAVSCPQMPSYESKNHFRNINYFLLKGSLDSSSNIFNIQQPNFRNSTKKWYAKGLAQAVRNSFKFCK